MKISGFWSYLKAVLLKPTWEFFTIGTLFTVFSVATWWRDNAASDRWKTRLDLRVLLPHWPFAWWVCIALAVLVYLVIKNGFTAWAEQFKENQRLKTVGGIRHNEGLPLTAPQVNLVAATQPELGRIEQLLLRNLSADPVYNLYFQPVKLNESLFINWTPDNIAVLEGESVVVISPIMTRVADGGSAIQFGGIGQLMNVLRMNENRSTYNIGKVAFSCEDKVQNRYLVTFIVEVNFAGNELFLKDTEKVLIGNRPNVYSPSSR